MKISYNGRVKQLQQRLLYSILGFASWPTKPKIFTYSPFAEEVCQPLDQNIVQNISFVGYLSVYNFKKTVS